MRKQSGGKKAPKKQVTTGEPTAKVEPINVE
jgi:hypothetical protein